MTRDSSETQSVKQLLEDCEGRRYKMSENNQRSLMKEVENIVYNNQQNFLTFTEVTTGPQPQNIKPPLNLVLCGRRAAVKTLAAKAILDQTELHSASNSSECVKHHGEACGRWVSLVELPALYDKPQEAVMEESLRCISLCDPEGVHAFILVLPVAPLTDEDKGELETIQKTFSSRVNDFTMILFTVESDPTDPAVLNFLKEDKDIQELCESCGGRANVLNIKDKQQICEMLDVLYKPQSYTAKTHAHAQAEKVLQQERHISSLKAKLLELESKKNSQYPTDVHNFVL
ncbi:GTPase IMAP family member 8-like [Haplochromis burtoni]|uniref:GTPase IMAP family member 8-like n=1 Tax=Haplochromis burtoni TaxID=8153 RepID=UPI001C2CC8D7|nr:GTPase IMAP family member 8-like [Haplochromis burtoni]